MADATATADSPYDIQVEDAGPARKRLKITVPADHIASKIEDSMGALASTAALPGFRKGRAPLALLERRFGTAVRDEARGQIIAESYSAALESNDLKPVSEPEPVDDIDSLELVDGKPLTFSVEVEVVPDIPMPELKGVAVKKPMKEADEDMIAAEIERQCVQAGTVVDAEMPLLAGDKIVGPGTATKDGEDEPFFEHPGVDVIVPEKEDGGNGAILGLLVEGLHDMLIGQKLGDEVSVSVTGPDSHELEHIRGEMLTIKMTIEQAMRIDPATPAEVVERFGLESEDILKEQVKLALEQRIAVEQQAAMREQVYTYLSDNAEFELPEKMTENQAQRMLERARLEMMYRGSMSAEEVEQKIAELRTEAQDESRKRLKLQFLLHKLADDLDIQVTEQEVNGRIAMIAQQRQVRPDKLKKDLIENGAIGQIGTQIRDHKAVDRIIDDASISEVPADDWNAEVEAKNAK
ncbi:MAG: trigger factor [Phycisphaerales bacterium]